MAKKPFEAFREDTLTALLDEAEKDHLEKQAAFEHAKITLKSKKEALERVAYSQHTYDLLKSVISDRMIDYASSLKEDVATLQTSSASVSEKLTGAINALKTAKAKLSAMQDAARKLTDASQDSCNEGELKNLEDKLTLEENEDFSSKVVKLEQGAEKIFDNANNTIKATVLVASIAAFSNVETFPGATDDLVNGITALGTDIDGRVAEIQSQLETTETEFGDSALALNKADRDQIASGEKELALSAVNDFTALELAEDEGNTYEPATDVEALTQIYETLKNPDAGNPKPPAPELIDEIAEELTDEQQGRKVSPGTKGRAGKKKISPKDGDADK
ncbi:MAG: hypothetical protein AAF206_30580 [Bacteroidota bacterium]